MASITDTQRIQPPIQPSATNGSAPLEEDSGPSLGDAAPRRRRSLLEEVGRWSMALTMFLVIGAPLLVLSVAAATLWQARTDEAWAVDAIVVLGAAQYNGRPSNVLEGRLDHALALYEGGYAPRIVVTGGKQPGDEFTEAEASFDYLVEQGVPARAILMEDVGRDTWRSLQGVEQVLAGTGAERILLVSDGFHLLRSKLMARELGFAAFGSPAPTSPIEPWSALELGYVVRETAAIFAFVPTMLG